MMFADIVLRMMYDMSGFRTIETDGIDPALHAMVRRPITKWPTNEVCNYPACMALYSVKLGENDTVPRRWSRLLEHQHDRDRRLKMGLKWSWYMEGDNCGRYGLATACDVLGCSTDGANIETNKATIASALYADSCGASTEVAVEKRDKHTSSSSGSKRKKSTGSK